MSTRSDPTAPRPMRKDAQRNHERILSAAGQVFAELGPTAQVEDVARAAGVGVGTVYRRFGSRDDLVAALVVHRLTAWASQARVALDEADPWEAFSSLVWSYADSCVTDHQLLDIGCASVLDLLNGADGEPGEVLTLVQEIISHGIDAKALPDSLTTDDVIVLMTAIGGVAAVPGLDWRPVLWYALEGIRFAASR